MDEKKVGLLTQKKPYLLRWDYLPKATWKTKVENMTEWTRVKIPIETESE